jgi:predicted enzyme related to lactoylglutathione lyase/catechol 2,3-dioxygenase-like lactoylglutathione lyase family enzyme
MSKMALNGIRSVDLEVNDLESAIYFYSSVWHLTIVERSSASCWFRGTGRYNHIRAVHKTRDTPTCRRITFDSADIVTVDAFYDRITESGCKTQKPHALSTPGGGYGFGFEDPEGRNFAIVCDVRDHNDARDVQDYPRKIVHVNVNAARIEETNRFMIDILGFRLVDHSGPLYFFHCDNTDHASIVTATMKNATLNHISFEMPNLDSCLRGGGRMHDAWYPIEWGPGRHGPGNNVFCYFAGPEEFPLEYTAEVQQIDDNYRYNGPEHWKWPVGRFDHWGITRPHTQRWKRIQDLFKFTAGA